MNKATKLDSSFSEAQQSVVDSLTQRLSVIKTELWYDISYGLPLFDKVKNKIAMDGAVASIVTSHPDVISMSSFESAIVNRKYSCKFQAVTKYGNVQVIF
ncbi:MAG: hypothetical protein PUI63_06775 [Alistipes senegalensis]|uniref:hypothetical protein n=1 Tax=Alistipes senegalensis TaxID=1288121 RepID=UPI00242B2A35|nr:hypothetical protein [Alistipes senegalensis]MDD7038929.1 hypothetical protein [Alistipes senegalensis]